MAQEKKAKDGKTDVPAIDDKTIDVAVKEINELANKVLYTGAIEIGEYILTNFFNDDEKEASSKNPRKNASFNKLCEREDLIISVQRMAQMVRVAIQERYFIANDINVDDLTYTHKASLTKLESGKIKDKLISDCIKNKWSTRMLDEKITKSLPQGKSRKPSQIQATKKLITSINRIDKSIDSSAIEMNTNEFEKMSPKQIEKQLKLLDQLPGKVEATKKKLDDKLVNYESVVNKLKEIKRNKEKSNIK